MLTLWKEKRRFRSMGYSAAYGPLTELNWGFNQRAWISLYNDAFEFLLSISNPEILTIFEIKKSVKKCNF